MGVVAGTVLDGCHHKAFLGDAHIVVEVVKHVLLMECGAAHEYDYRPATFRNLAFRHVIRAGSEHPQWHINGSAVCQLAGGVRDLFHINRVAGGILGRLIEYDTAFRHFVNVGGKFLVSGIGAGMGSSGWADGGATMDSISGAVWSAVGQFMMIVP